MSSSVHINIDEDATPHAGYVLYRVLVLKFEKSCADTEKTVHKYKVIITVSNMNYLFLQLHWLSQSGVIQTYILGSTFHTLSGSTLSISRIRKTTTPHKPMSRWVKYYVFCTYDIIRDWSREGGCSLIPRFPNRNMRKRLECVSVCVWMFLCVWHWYVWVLPLSLLHWLGGDPATASWNRQPVWAGAYLVWWRLGGKRHLLEQYSVSGMAIQWKVNK
jgi:hypothetical protein